MVRLGVAGKAWLGSLRFGTERFGRHGKFRRDVDWLGVVRPGRAGESWRGKVWYRKARCVGERFGLKLSLEEARKILNKPKGKGSKFTRSPEHERTIDGIVFASKAEAKRYTQLKPRLKDGEIVDLVMQRKYELLVNGQKVGEYTSDFEYRDGAKNWEWIVEDVKSGRSGKGKFARDWPLRRKVFEAMTGQKISVVTVKL